MSASPSRAICSRMAGSGRFGHRPHRTTPHGRDACRCASVCRLSDEASVRRTQSGATLRPVGSGRWRPCTRGRGSPARATSRSTCRSADGRTADADQRITRQDRAGAVRSSSGTSRSDSPSSQSRSTATMASGSPSSNRLGRPLRLDVLGLPCAIGTRPPTSAIVSARAGRRYRQVPRAQADVLAADHLRDVGIQDHDRRPSRPGRVTPGWALVPRTPSPSGSRAAASPARRRSRAARSRPAPPGVRDDDPSAAPDSRRRRSRASWKA